MALGDSELPGCSAPVAAGALECLFDDSAFKVVHGRPVVGGRGWRVGGGGVGFPCHGEWQVLDADELSPAEDNGSFDGVFKLAHIAGKGMLEEPVEGLAGDALHILSIPP